MSTESTRAASRWITRILPLALAAAVGYTTYVTVVRSCVDFLIGAQGNHGAAIAVLVLYFIFMLLMIASYLRLIIVINVDPGLVPLGPLALERRKSEKAKAARRSRQSDDLEGQPYNTGPDPNPDSPGLEKFYTKDVFICENDGRPKWCSECCNWKPDRTHHSSELNRCVLRMDHYCPWAGGMIGENSFKFFIQFTAYTCCYCAVVLGANGSSLKKKHGFGESVDGYMIGALALGGFFGLFTFMMTLTSLRYVSVNMTNVDMIGAKSKVYQLAVRVPRGSPGTDKYHVVNYPLPDGQGNSTAASTATQMEMAERRQAQSQDARDALAHRTFAILKTEAGENPWDLGFRENWKEVMGTDVVDWFLPIRRSPCISHDQTDSFYRMGPLLPKLRERHGLAPATGDNEGFEMADVTKNRS